MSVSWCSITVIVVVDLIADSRSCEKIRLSTYIVCLSSS